MALPLPPSNSSNASNRAELAAAFARSGHYDLLLSPRLAALFVEGCYNPWRDLETATRHFMHRGKPYQDIVSHCNDTFDSDLTFDEKRFVDAHAAVGSAMKRAQDRIQLHRNDRLNRSRCYFNWLIQYVRFVRIEMNFPEWDALKQRMEQEGLRRNLMGLYDSIQRQLRDDTDAIRAWEERQADDVASVSTPDDDVEGKCPICWQDYGDADCDSGSTVRPVRLNECGHVYCKKCLTREFAIAEFPRCAICRREIAPDREPQLDQPLIDASLRRRETAALDTDLHELAGQIYGTDQELADRYEQTGLLMDEFDVAMELGNTVLERQEEDEEDEVDVVVGLGGLNLEEEV
jgi:hypothetical protein